ncbi:MAG: Ppx/GppA family phosphatase [Parvularculaceae bacterium]|nr:Ppx/GppA family phosphatase [Parvularculaceae bacterium]
MPNAPAHGPSNGAAPVRRAQDRFAALDLGTNNCRLLIAAPRSKGFRVFDAFSRIVRLGEGMSASGALSAAAMQRTIDALKICAEKIERRDVTRQRCIATQACRAASNGAEFLSRVRDETGLQFEIITPAEEARLAVAGCADLLDGSVAAGLIFDIGGGSTELSWVRPSRTEGAQPDVAAWTSLPIGVVSLSERFGGREISRATYQEVVDWVRGEIAAFGDPAGLRNVFVSGGAHYLGTSGTVTSIAGVHLNLARYRRDAVDGLWLSADEVRDVTERLRAMNYAERADEPCIGVERADLVVCGCAILDALLLEWPATRIRVADRGLREGILVGLAQAHNRERDRRRSRRRRRNAAARVNAS